MTKRILALMLAVLLAVSCFALTACGGEEEKTDDNKTEDNKTDDKVEGDTDADTDTDTDADADTDTDADADTDTDADADTDTDTDDDDDTDSDDDDDADVDIPDVMLFDEKATIIVGKTYNLGEMSLSMADTVKYASENAAIATVDEAGVITGVAAGQTNIIVYVVVNGKDYEGAKFPVTVEEPWRPTDPTTLEAVTAKETLTKYESLAWYNVSVTANDEIKKYNIRGLESATGGPVEIWSNHLQFLFMLNQSEANFTAGAGDMDNYAYRFDVYYRPYDPNNDKGNYKKATLKPWSIYTDTADRAIYRLPFYNEFDMENNPLVEGQEYEVIIVAREGETQLGYCESSFTWTDSCASFVEYAEYDSTVLKGSK